eukprot:gene23129-29322_t
MPVNKFSRVDRIGYSDGDEVSERKSIVLHCSLVDSGTPSGGVDSKDLSSAELVEISLSEDNSDVVLQRPTNIAFGIAQITSIYKAYKQRILPTNLSTRRQLLSAFYSGEQCRETCATLATVCRHLTETTKRIHDQHQRYVLDLLNEISAPISVQINHADDFLHVFRVMQDLCKVLHYFIDLALVANGPLNAQEDSTQTEADATTVERFQNNTFTDETAPRESHITSPLSHSIHSIVDFTEKLQFVGAVTESINILVSTIVISVVPIMTDALPVPYDISTEEWARITHAMCGAREALSILGDTLGTLTTVLGVDSDVVSSCHRHLINSLRSLDSAVDDYRDRAILAVCEALELSVVDSAHRQEWFSNSPFFRDKKVSHGVLASTSLVRSATHDLMMLCGSGGHPDLVVYTAMQLQLAVQSVALRNYLMLRTSRVRLFQWRLDLCHLLYTAMDSLARIVRYRHHCAASASEQDTAPSGEKNERSLTLSQINVSGDSAKGAGLNEIFVSSDELCLWREMSDLLLYTALVVVVVTNSSACDVTELLSSLQTVVDSSVTGVSMPPPDSLTFVGITRDVMDLLKVLLPPSVVDHAFCIPSFPSVGTRTEYDLTDDITAYCGFFASADSSAADDVSSSSLHFCSDEERLLFKKENKTQANIPHAGARAVIFARIACMLTVPLTTESDLWRLLRGRQASLSDLHSQLNDDEAAASASSMMICALLPRRFEAMDCAHPKLIEVQESNAQLINQFIERNRL